MTDRARAEATREGKSDRYRTQSHKCDALRHAWRREKNSSTGPRAGRVGEKGNPAGTERNRTSAVRYGTRREGKKKQVGATVAPRTIRGATVAPTAAAAAAAAAAAVTAARRFPARGTRRTATTTAAAAAAAAAAAELSRLARALGVLSNRQDEPPRQRAVLTDRSVVTALPSTTPRPVLKSSADDSETPHRLPRDHRVHR